MVCDCFHFNYISHHIVLSVYEQKMDIFYVGYIKCKYKNKSRCNKLYSLKILSSVHFFITGCKMLYLVLLCLFRTLLECGSKGITCSIHVFARKKKEKNTIQVDKFLISTCWKKKVNGLFHL